VALMRQSEAISARMRSCMSVLRLGCCGIKYILGNGIVVNLNG
jgi:hypothetical protein